MKRLALITLQNANNYGAVLQTFAMQKVLGNYCKVVVLNYENRHISRSFDLIRITPTLRGILGVGKDVLRIFPRYRAIKKFKQFITSHFRLTTPLSSNELVQGKAGGYDVYIAGSDQLWNPMCVSQSGQLDLHYFLDFAPDTARKISYASSVGGYQFTAEESITIKKNLSSFYRVSVREKNTQEYLVNILGKKVAHVLDPTLLLTKQDWLTSLNISPTVNVKEKYILLFTVPKVKLIRNAVDYFAKKLGLKVIALDQGLTAGAKVDEQFRDAGPIEFIDLIANAEFVITDSFHGTCFALNFEKPFIAVTAGKHANRIESLLTLVGLEQNLAVTEADFDRANLKPDFSGPIEKLNSARKWSMEFIEDALR